MKTIISNSVKLHLSRIMGDLLAILVIFLGISGGVTSATTAPALTGQLATPIDIPDLLATSAASVSREVAGQAKTGAGTLQKKLGKVSGEVEGTANQVKGRMMQGSGKAQSQVEDTQQDIKNRIRRGVNDTQNTADKASNRFSETADQVGDNVSETAGNAVDAVKNFFGQ